MLRRVCTPLARAPRLARTLNTSSALPLKVTSLSNGVRVATDPTPGHFVAAGVYVDAGSRYEGNRTRGASHMVDRLGFKVRARSPDARLVAPVATPFCVFLAARSLGLATLTFATSREHQIARPNK